MNRKTILSGAVMALCITAAQGTLWTTNFSINAAIPDADESGFSSTKSVNGLFTDLPLNNTTVITDIRVTLNISGGYNGDLYGYLVHDSGFAVLLNRVGVASTNGFGYSTTGFNVTIATGGNDIHF